MTAFIPKFSRIALLVGAVACLDVAGHASAGVLPRAIVKEITLPHLEPAMPIAPGRDEFMRACTSCHSSRYVTVQPPFARKQWEATVRKMIDTYGAPVDEAQAVKIIDRKSVV